MNATADEARRLSVAPMMDWTDRHCRAFHRAFTSQTLLYTEMVTTGAVLHGDRERLLGFDPVEQPVALQLGGSDPDDLAASARIGAELGYAEINLNVGCPSDRVQSGRFGACLMREPQLVADCMAAMGEAVDVPVTVKCRIGVDDQEPADALFDLVDRCAGAGVTTFVVHARKAWLKGLSPKENRDIPPLDYGLVRRLKAERPELTIVINGGIAGLAQAEGFLIPDETGPALDGVMLGRSAYHEPALLGQADRRIYGEATGDIDPFEAIDRYRSYVAARLAEGVHLAAMTRHILGAMHGRPGARAFRRILTVDSIKPGAGLDVIDRAVEAVREAESRREAA
ncbi:tRNA dihydrouridine(20/20a) synthase DusA [Brevundimonas sp.]|uniref:tRNA dihydrouridine(20/20a) synthase DusA n=1 Tax=Brevundimonas sp. TaxID=1871086 RepID=UPI0025D93001|nr:tRNA dihydrouridine(20/20a) synthase DusA [Brevundimonas sp.]